MWRSGIWTAVYFALVALALVMELVSRLVSPGMVFVFAGALAIPLAFAIRFVVRRDAAEISHAIRILPMREAPAPRATLAEFSELQDELRAASLRLKAQSEASQEDREQLESLLDSMQDAVVAVDAAGRIQWTNHRMQRLVPGAGGVVRLGQALVHTIRDPEVLECVRAALEQKAVCVRRSTSMVPGRFFEVNASPMPGGGAVAVLHDITRIEEVERTQRDFVANVSHELRTPLTSISGYVETLLDHERDLSPTAREFLGTILKNATRMNRLTEDLLVMARVEGPSGELHPAPIRADVLVSDAMKAMQGLVQENQAVLELGEMTPTQVFADADAVMQVLGNLIENAIKYGQSGRPADGSGSSRVVISAREVAVPFEAVEFSVQDFGMGIGSEHLSRIFERFYRVDKTRSRESGGTGLGLAIARYMVQAQGGNIRAESELGTGSTFIFTLPRALYPVA